MERRYIIDEMLMHGFSVEGLTTEEVNSWAKSPITKSLMEYLAKDGTMLAAQYGDDCVMIHLGIPLDVKKAIADRGEPLEIDNGNPIIIWECDALKD